jgi:hypothetical protein
VIDDLVGGSAAQSVQLDGAHVEDEEGQPPDQAEIVALLVGPRTGI